ncbi:MAG: Kelch repeat-containing protein [Bacteroidales bacterium]
MKHILPFLFKDMLRPLFTIFFLLVTFLISAQGLFFQSSRLPIKDRTSYDVFTAKQPEFSSRFHVAFDMSLYDEMPIGFILRLKDQQNDKVYNLFYDGQGESILFKLNEEGKCSLLTAEIHRNELRDKYWFKVNILFDLKNDSIQLQIDKQSWNCSNISLPETCSPKIVFGKSDYVIDVPSFAIKNLRIGNEAEYCFPLSENKGSQVHDKKGPVVGNVINPKWLINDSYHWKFCSSASSMSVAGVNYNPVRKEVYYFNRDSISVYHVRSQVQTSFAFQKPCPVNMLLGSNFINPSDNSLYCYELFYPNGQQEFASVASLDLEHYTWSRISDDMLTTQLFHHAGYFDEQKNQFTVFGGFGYMHFSNDFYQFGIDSSRWNIMNKLTGDPIYPRYFTSLGHDKKSNSLYIFGGMGNQSGDQMVGRTYFYDLHKLNLNNRQVTKLWKIKWNGVNMVPIKDMVMLDEDHFYTLCYPESVSDSYLQLYRFSIKDGSFEVLGDSIPIYSDKITTNARLFYDAQESRLFATVQEFGDDDVRSKVKIYSLTTPPVSALYLENFNSKKNPVTLYVILAVAVLVVLLLLFYIIRRYKRRKTEIGLPEMESFATDYATDERANSIYLFGDFMVRDRHNRDITYMFTARRKQTFCLALQHSMEEGINSQKLSTLLWPDRPEDKVKNSRGVTINHLRKILSEMDDIELIYNKGCFKIDCKRDFYCDYLRFIEIISEKDIESDREELAQILNRGKFLKSSNDPLFDEFKDTVECQLQNVLQQEMKTNFDQGNFRLVIRFADAMLHTDPLNEDAVAYLLRSLLKIKEVGQAQSRYRSISIEYKKMMGNEYPHKFDYYHI